MIKISLVLCNIYIVPRNQDKFLFYSNNYIDWDQFKQIYDFNWIERDIKNVDVVACKLELTLTRVTNYRLEITGKENQKKEEMIKKWKTEAITVKCQRVRESICLFSEEKENFDSDTEDEIDPNQADNKYLLPIRKAIKEKI